LLLNLLSYYYLITLILLLLLNHVRSPDVAAHSIAIC